jgi:hypothetical protein
MGVCLRPQLVLVALACSLGPACVATPAPYGAAVIVVDTDLPAPSVVNRLRVDGYAKDGTWFESIDYARPNTSSWPVSFGIASPDGSDREVLLRLRAYSDGNVRDYQGERYQPPATFTEPYVPHDLDGLCSNAPALPVGGTVTLRRGRDGFVPSFADCTPAGLPNTIGAAGAYVDIETTGPYCIAALGTVPSGTFAPPEPPFRQVTLELREACKTPSSAVACDSGISDVANAVYVLPKITATLQAHHRYYALVSGYFETQGPSDVVLGAAAGSCDALPALPQGAPPAAPGYALDLRGDPSLTPKTEPAPAMTVDRLGACTCTRASSARCASRSAASAPV